MSRRRPWLALVPALFCLQRFSGLDRTGVDGDRAISPRSGAAGEQGGASAAR